MSTFSVWQYNGTRWKDLGRVSELADANCDTKVMVEKNADEDMIRFEMGGTEYFRMDNGRLEELVDRMAGNNKPSMTSYPEYPFWNRKTPG